MRKYINLSKYYCFQLSKSYTSYVFLISFLLIPILVILLSYFLNTNILYYSSFIIAIVFQIYLFISAMFLAIKLFNENKYNLSDIKLLGKNYKRIDLYLIKYILITSFLLIGNILMMISSLIVLFSLSCDSQTMNAIVVSNFFGLIINIFFIVPLLIITSSCIKRIWSPVLSILILLFFPCSSIISNLFLTNPSMNNDLTINVNNKNSKVTYNKIYKFDENNNLIDSCYAYNINYGFETNKNNNLDFSNNINNISNLNALIPGNITLSLQQAIYSLIFKDTQNIVQDYTKYKTSLVKLTINDEQNISSFLEKGSVYALTNIGSKNIFDLKTNEIIDYIISDLNNLKLNSKNLEILNNSIELESILFSLQKNKIWNFEKFSENQKNFIYDLLGIEYSSFFYTWYYWSIISSNIGTLFGKIKEQFNESFANLVKYLWTNYDTYFNLIVVNNPDLTILVNKLFNKYPINYTYNSNLNASPRDLEFFKNYFIIIEDHKVNILLNDLIYSSISLNEFNSLINKNITSQNEWISYLTNENIPTTGFLQNIYKIISDRVSNVIDYNFENSNFNLNSFQAIFSIRTMPFIFLWELYLTMQIICIFLLFLLSWIVYKNVRLN